MSGTQHRENTIFSLMITQSYKNNIVFKSKLLKMESWSKVIVLFALRLLLSSNICIIFRRHIVISPSINFHAVLRGTIEIQFKDYTIFVKMNGEINFN